MIEMYDDFVMPVYGSENNTNQCLRCLLNDECELLQEYNLLTRNGTAVDLPAYKQQGREKCTLNSNFALIPCGADSVSDGIGDHFKIHIDYDHKIVAGATDKWEPGQPVFISAQTGKGKNYFIENNLLSYLKELNHKNKTDYKLLIISNRIALRMQIKNRIKNHYDEDFDEAEIYHYQDCAEVITYQGLLKRIGYLKNSQKSDVNRYLYVVCDEAHFFTSDAMFNPYTEKILSVIVNTFKNAIRIYMSATPYECLEYIQKYEARGITQPNMGVFYHFKRDYNYLDVKYYTDKKELHDIIINSGDQNWMIFIDNKKECENLKNNLANLSGAKDKYFSVDASSKYDEKYQNIVLSEELVGGVKVLIATSVLDSGVNLRGIHNIVISDMSKIKCLQVLGRARVSPHHDKITLYIKRFDKKQIESKISQLERQQDAYHAYDLAYKQNDRKNKNELKFLDKYYNDQFTDWENAKYWFGRDEEVPSKVYPNEIARSQVEKIKLLYESILEDMQQTEQEGELEGQIYLEYQISWFGHVYRPENDIALIEKDRSLALHESKVQEFIDFLESYVIAGTHMFEDEQSGFREKFTKLHDSAFSRLDKNQSRTYGLSKINSFFHENKYGYKIEAERDSQTKKTYWKIIRYNYESNQPESE